MYFTLERVLVECFYTFIMASETNLTDVERAINQLQGVLNENYLAAEKIMALRTPNTSELKAILAKIDKSYDELVGAMASARQDTEAIVAVTQNQHEFNLRKKEWFSTLDNTSSSTAAVPEPSTIAPRPSSFVSPSSSRHSSRSSRSSSKLSSSSSSRISAKHLEATAKLKIAQLKLVHIEERANEEAQRLRLRANEEAQRLRLKKEIEQREADREIALARVEYEIYNEFAAETTRLSDDVTTILSSDNENTVETVVPKTCSELTFARSSSLLSNNLSGSNTLSLGGLPPAKSTMSTGPVLGLPLVQSTMSTGPVLDLLPVQSSMFTGPVLGVPPIQSSMSTGPVLGLPPIQSSMSTGPVLGVPPIQSSMSTGPVLGLPPVQSSMSTGPVLGLPPVQSSMSTGPVLGVPPIQSSMSTGPVLGLPPVQSSMSTGPVLGVPPIQSSMSTGPVLGLPRVQSSMSTGPVLGVPPIQSSMSTGPVLGLPPVQSSMSTGPVLGVPPIQSSMSAGPVLGLPPIQSSMSTGQVLGLPLIQSSMCTGPVLGPLPIQSSSSTCQVWSSSYVHGPLPAHPDISAGSSYVQVAPSVAHSYNFNRLPASNPLGPPPSSADLPIYSHVSPLLYPGVYNQNSVNYDSLFLPRPEFPKFSGDPLEYKAFMNNFETHIEPRVRDEKTLICLLLQHCSKDVKDRIEHFATSEVQPYTVAKQRLNKEYGSPWVISDACEQRLKKFPSVRSGDGKQLRRFAELLEKTGVIVKDIRQYTSLDSLDMLTELVNKLPYDLKKRWVSKSVQIQNYLGHLANFLHFVDFVRKESDEVNSLFGLRSLHPKTTSTKTKASSFGSVMSKTSANVNSKSSISGSRHVTQVGSCWYCKNTSHILFDCKDFKQIPVEDRISFVKESKLCHKCLSSKHKTRECKRSKLCSVTGCKGLYHHTLLHKFATTKEHPPKTSSEDKAVVPVTCGFTKSESCSNSDNSHVYLCIVPVRVSFGENVVSTYAFLDQGSTHSFCKRSLLQELKASGTRERLQLKTITGTTNDMDSVSCNLVVSDLDSDSSFSLSNVHSVENIPVQPNNVSVDAEVCKLPHLQDINLKSLPHASVNLLIGADVPELFCIYSARRGPRGTPCAIETPLGWSLLGPSLSPSQGSNCTVNFIVKKDATEMVARMWETEFEPGTSIFDDSFSNEDRLAHTLMQSEICTIDGHYQLPLLWKEPYKNQLLNNLPLAQRRLTSLKRRLQRDDNLRVKYAEVVESYLSKGNAREVQQAYLTKSNDPIWYQPHHPVTNVHKPEKVRVVFDCAAKYHGLSLNDTWMKGPTFMNNLIGVLIGFRKNRIALVDLCPGPPTVESLALTDLVSGCLATGSHALADLGPGPPVPGSLALADFGPGPPVTGSFALADLGPGPPATGSLADTDSNSSASVFMLFLSLVYYLTFLGYFALCDWVPTSLTAKSLTLWRSVNVLVYTEYVSRTCLVTSTAPTVMLFFLESLHIPEFSEFITHADPILGFPVIKFLTFWVFLNSVHASIHAQFISQVASVLERSISGFLISPDLDVSSAGYTTPFIFSVYLTPSDFNLAVLWYISIPPGLFSKNDCYVKRRWAQIQYLANQFWKRWMDEFVPNLLQRQKWFEVKRNFQVNDVVLLVEDTQQRSKWVLGRILETYPDKHGLVRTVLVKTQTSVVKRPIAKLCPVVTHD